MNISSNNEKTFIVNAGKGGEYFVYNVESEKTEILKNTEEIRQLLSEKTSFHIDEQKYENDICTFEKSIGTLAFINNKYRLYGYIYGKKNRITKEIVLTAKFFPIECIDTYKHILLNSSGNLIDISNEKLYCHCKIKGLYAGFDISKDNAVMNDKVNHFLQCRLNKAGNKEGQQITKDVMQLAREGRQADRDILLDKILQLTEREQYMEIRETLINILDTTKKGIILLGEERQLLDEEIKAFNEIEETFYKERNDFYKEKNDFYKEKNDFYKEKNDLNKKMKTFYEEKQELQDKEKKLNSKEIELKITEKNIESLSILYDDEKSDLGRLAKSATAWPTEIIEYEKIDYNYEFRLKSAYTNESMRVSMSFYKKTIVTVLKILEATSDYSAYKAIMVIRFRGDKDKKMIGVVSCIENEEFVSIVVLKEFSKFLVDRNDVEKYELQYKKWREKFQIFHPVEHISTSNNND